MKTSTAVGAGVVVVATLGVVYVIASNIRSSDEAPIRVRNGGSMDILASEDRQWELEQTGDNEDPDPSYSHEPNGVDLDPFDKDLFVKVLPSTAQCTGGSNKADGRVVQVQYTLASGGTVTATFKRAKSGPLQVNRRTKVRRPQDLELDASKTTLRHSPAGFISQVKVGNWECNFANASALSEILICSSQNRPECQ